MTGPSGTSGPFGRLADWFDGLPVGGGTLLGGVVAILVAVGGTIVALTRGGPDGGDCARTPLQHVYRPSRLRVLKVCAETAGTVVAWRHEHDGDWHVSMRMDGPGWTNRLNVERQHGYTVVEFVPLFPRPKLRVGMRLHLIGTQVEDLQHGRLVAGAMRGWVELHPVFAFDEITAGTARPNRPGLAPPTESGSE